MSTVSTPAQSALSALKLQKRTLRRVVSKKLAGIGERSLDEQSHAIMTRVLAHPAVQKCRSISCYLNMPMGEVRTTGLVERLLEEGKSLYIPKIIPHPALGASSSSMSTQTQATPAASSPPIPTTTMDFFKIYSKADLHSIQPSGLWGIREPGDRAEDGRARKRVLYAPSVDAPLSSEESDTGKGLADLDVILLPGVAFDRTLSRLGHGKGYYDRFVAGYVGSGRKKPVLIGLALTEQVLDADAEVEGSGIGEAATRVVPVGEYDWELDALVWPDGIVEREQ
ncbi:hypothetical protein BJ165DRAFT_1401200 [Panaeolus papilionaceus]|nr:hypothetical protein BJ165DRAFT_1401200 [Panaeolus papilionaceus]